MTYLAYVLYLAIGAAAGSLYFLLLYRSVRLYAEGTGLAGVAPLYVMRVAGAAAVFWFVAQEGALPLVLALGGFVLAREIVRRAVGA